MYVKIIVTLIILFFVSNANLNATNLQLNLTDKEQTWLQEHPVIQVAIMDYWNFNEKGECLETDMLHLLNKYAGTNITPVKFTAWKDAYTKAVNGKDLQGIMGLSYSQKREKESFFYSPSYGFTPAYLIVRNSNNSIRDIEDLSDKTVLLQNKSILHDIVKIRVPSAKIKDLKIIKEMYKKLSSDDTIDAIYSYFINEDKLNKYNLKIAKIVNEKSGEVSIGISHKYPELSSIINKAFKIIPKEEIFQMNNKQYRQDKTKVILNQKEKDWLYKKIPIRYVYDKDWAPFEWKDKFNNHTGITADVLSIISKKTGLIFEEVPTNSWSESVRLAQTNKIDMYSAVVYNKERAEYMNFTKNNIFQYPAVFLTKQTSTIDYTYKDNIKHKKIGGVSDNTLIKKVRKIYPNNTFLDISSTTDGFNKLRDGVIDLLLINAPVAHFYMTHRGFNDIKVVKEINFKFSLKIAVQKSMPKEILSIIDKGLEKITQEEIDTIYHKWTTTQTVKETNWLLLIQIVSVIVFLLFLALFYSYTLKQMVKEKTHEISLNLAIMDRNLIISDTDTKGIITYCNKNMSKISGYSNDELLGKTHSIIRHPDMPKEIFVDLWKTIKSGQTWQSEIKNKKKDGSFYWVNTIISPKYNADKKLFGYKAIRYEITDTKAVEELHTEIENTQKEIILAMGSIGEARSKETGNHVRRVAEYSKLFALKYGLPLKEAEMLKQASPMHDIGKIAIPDNILNKPSRFNKEERLIMDTHAQLGFNMLKYSDRKLLQMAAIVAYEHHEKWDGTGYPNNLSAEGIHIYGRITALADVFDALGSSRVYKEAWTDDRIFKMFKEERGKHFDPKLIDIFFDNLEEFLKIRNSMKECNIK